MNTENHSSTLYLLGSGTPTPTQSRFGSAYVLRTGEDYLMFDCGPAATDKMVKAGLWPTQIGYLFFTHHHFDHNVDYPCFLLCRWDQSIGKEKQLEVFGPSPTEEITDKLIGPGGAFAIDWKARVGSSASQNVYKNRGGSLPRPGPSVNVRDVGPGKVMKANGWEVTAELIDHMEPWLDTLAYRVNTDSRSIVFAGDTRPCEQINKLAHGADILVISCWDHQDKMNDNKEAMGISGTIAAAGIAAKAGIKMLVLTHTGSGLSQPESQAKAISDISQVYDGKIVFGEELMKLPIW